MPFSLESASMNCCNWLAMRYPLRPCPGPRSSEFHVESRAGDVRHRNPLPLVLAHRQENVLAVDALQAPFEMDLSVHRLIDNQLHKPSGKPPEIIRATQRSIQPGR